MAKCKVGVQFHPQNCTIDDLRTAWKSADALGVDSIWVWDQSCAKSDTPTITQSPNGDRPPRLLIG